MAVTVTVAELETAIEVDTATATRLLAVAAALVDKAAPAAPGPVQNEAAIRVAGWLAEAPASGLRREVVGPVSSAFSPAMTGALRASGAMSLLAPFKRPRAAVVG